MDDAYIAAALNGQWEVKFNGDAFPSQNGDAQGAFGYTDTCTDARLQTVTVEAGRTSVCVPRMSTIVFSRTQRAPAPGPAPTPGPTPAPAPAFGQLVLLAVFV